MLAGCGGDTKAIGNVGYVKGFTGLVAADEPRAALAARDVLSAGGTAADAATSLYFSLAVTLPSTASLGGGGSCVVYSRDSGAPGAEVIDFHAPAAGGAGTLPVAVPANARGMFLLQARYGRLRWESLLAGPERMAREGFTITRALANDLALAAPQLARDPQARRLFFRPDGRVMGEGDRLQNPDLAAVLAGLRYAPGDFYSGLTARTMVQSAQKIGAGLRLADLEATHPRLKPATTVPFGNDLAVVPAASAAVLARRGSDDGARTARHDGSAPGTGFVVMDSYGGAVACSFTANGLFGSGRMLPGAGFALAAPPAEETAPAVAALVFNPHTHEVHFAGTATGGVSAAAALATAMVSAAEQGQPAGQAIAAAAAGLPPGAASRMEAFTCASGPPDNSRCQVVTDPRGFGYAMAIGQ